MDVLSIWYGFSSFVCCSLRKNTTDRVERFWSLHLKGRESCGSMYLSPTHSSLFTVADLSGWAYFAWSFIILDPRVSPLPGYLCTYDSWPHRSLRALTIFLLKQTLITLVLKQQGNTWVGAAMWKKGTKHAGHVWQRSRSFAVQKNP